MSTQVLNEVLSDPFTVYTPKTLPGMTGLEERGQWGWSQGAIEKREKCVCVSERGIVYRY